MKQLAIYCSIFAALVHTSANAFGEEDYGPNYEHLKSVDRGIGEWVCEFPLTEAVPGLGEKGDMVKVTLDIEWGLKRNIIEMEMTATLKGEVVASSEGMTGWDADRKKIVHYTFSSRGEFGEHVVKSHTQDKIVEERRSVSSDGVITTNTTTIEFIDDDTFTVVSQEMTVDGQKQEDGPKLTFKRKKK